MRQLSASQLKEWLADAGRTKPVLLDVRELWEFETCRIAGSQHIPMRQIPEHLGDLSQDKHLLIHCHHGGRSMRVTELLRSRGFTAVTNVAGGIDAWSLQIDQSLRRY